MNNIVTARQGKAYNNFDCNTKKKYEQSNRQNQIKSLVKYKKDKLRCFKYLLSKHLNYAIHFENSKSDEHAIEKIAEVLSVPKNKLLINDEVPSFIYNSKKQIESTKDQLEEEASTIIIIIHCLHLKDM